MSTATTDREQQTPLQPWVLRMIVANDRCRIREVEAAIESMLPCETTLGSGLMPIGIAACHSLKEHQRQLDQMTLPPPVLSGATSERAVPSTTEPYSPPAAGTPQHP